MIALGVSLAGNVPFEFNLGAEESERWVWKFGRCDAFSRVSEEAGAKLHFAFLEAWYRTFAMPTLLAKLGPEPSLRLPLLGVLARRPRPNISCANASFFLRRRSVCAQSGASFWGSCWPLLTGLDDVVERNDLFICRHGNISSLDQGGLEA